MPSKLKKAIAVVKDQTSISLAMVKTGRTHHNSASSLEVAILKATTHDDSPINPHHLSDILRIVSSNRTHASLCARSLGRRVGRTRNWTVALKCLLVALHLLRSSDPHFPKEVLLAVKSGHNLLDLSSSAAVSSSCPRPISSFVRSFASYLDLRLHSLLAASSSKRLPEAASLLNRIPHWQRLLAMVVVMAMGPSAATAARSSRLVQASMHVIVQESFDLYKDISDGLAVILDGFFHLEYVSCVGVLDACVKASSQFEELIAFYDFCRSSNVGVASGYPDVRRIPEELIDTLQEFLKDQSSFPATPSGRRRLSLSLVGMVGTADGEPYNSYGHDHQSDPGVETQSSMGDLSSAREFASMRSDPDSGLDLFEHGEAMMLQGTTSGEKEGEKDDDDESSESCDQDAIAKGWELALLETAMQQSSTSNSNREFSVDYLEEDTNSSLLDHTPSNQYNPFLQDTLEDPSPVCKGGENVGMSNGNFFSRLGLYDGCATPSGVQPNFWVDFSDQGKGGSIANPKEVDLFANFDKGSAYKGDAIGNGAIDLFANFDDVNSTTSNAFDGGGFHANAPNGDDPIIPNAIAPTGLAPSDEFASLNRGYKNTNAGSTPLGVDYGVEVVSNPLTAIVATNELTSTPTFKATPTFKVASDHNQQDEPEQSWSDDFFGSVPSVEQGNYQTGSRSTTDQQNVMKQQEMWLQIQDKILTKHST